MARKYDLISELYERTCFAVTDNPVNWQNFLKTAGRNFRLRFDEQLLLYAQRPDATAVLEIEKWNRTFGRWVNRGATGIAVFEEFEGKRQRLTHYFDISDTHSSRYSRPVPIWKMEKQQEQDVIETLKNTFGISENGSDLPKVIMDSVSNAVDDNIADYLSDFNGIIAGSNMEHLPENEREAMYIGLVKNSVAYMMMARLGIETDNYYSINDFSFIKNCNSQDTLNAVGFATSDIAEMGLMPVSRTINAYTKENRIIESNHQSDYNKDNQNEERGADNETDRIHDGRRLQSAESDTSRAARSDTGEMVADEKNLSEEQPQNPILQSSDERQNDRTSGRDTGQSDGTGGVVSEENVGRNGADRGIERKRYDEMGADDEQSSPLSAGNREGTSDIRLNEKPLPSVNEQLELFERAEEKPASAFLVPQEVIDATIKGGSGFVNGKMRIYEQFQKSFSSKENADFLKNEYGIGGSSSAGGYDDYGQDHNAKGLKIYKSNVKDRPNILLNWSKVANRIEELIAADRYLNDKEKKNYPIWLEAEEVKRAEMRERNQNREILNTAPTMVAPEEPDAEEKVEIKPDNTAEYEYHLGDAVYIGSEKYEILSFDSTRVMLYDYEMPLFNKEFTREDFDRKVRENPLNDFLIVTDKEPDNEPDLAERLVEFIKDFDYYNYQDNLDVDSIDDVRDRLTDGDYVAGIAAFMNEELEDLDRESGDRATIEKLLSDLRPYMKSDDVKTNMGTMPREDHQEIVAVQNGFDSYEDMRSQGFSISDGSEKEEESKSIEPIIPAWEKKKNLKVKSFDLHPDIPISERNTFDLRNHPVEEATKKERFRRNIMAIQLLKKCESENRFATPEEQEVLSKYVGWGGIPEAFDDSNSAWGTEYLELKIVLTPEEYTAARESTLTAFYTPPAVSSAIYKAMEQMGFKEGNLLEPSCGIGNFIGMLPEAMAETKIYGVELDKVSAGIAQQLYQKSSIAAQGFEEVNVPDSFFDGVIGNVPFGDFKVLDKRYDKHNFLIHDYFFAKSLDKLRPGGVMALVTSKGTMDKENSKVRKYIAQRAELLGAVRLPNDTFKGNAGTEVVSDILFLQKRDRLIDIEPDWVHLDTSEDGIRMNSYFVAHPEMILGEMKMVSGRFGMEATCEAYEGVDLENQLEEAVQNIHAEIVEYELEDELQEDNSIPADVTVRNFSYTVLEDTIYFRENSRMSPVEVSATAQNRIKGMIGIRDAVRTLIEMQTADYPDTDIKMAQTTLNIRYDAYTKKYGLINSRANTSVFGDDSSYSLLSALEIINENGELERKADMFYKRTIKPHTPVTEVDTASEALAVSMGEKACIDMDYMQQLLDKSEEEIFNDLKGAIFLNPMYGYSDSSERKYVMADEYLSGNVREKLDIARRTAELYPEDYKINVEALEKVQPKELTASEISVRLGATWLPPEIVQQYIFKFLETPRYAQWNIKVHFSPFTSEWNIEGKSYDRGNVKANSTYGTGRINAYKIMEETLNLKDVRIFDYIEDDEGKKKAVLNKKETAIAQAKQEMIKQGFVDWVWSEPSRREKLTKLYNEKFNSIRPREYDGSHIIFNGMNPEIDLREHQKNAVAHILYGGNTLLAHAVGAGKTFEMVAASQESKRLGLCNKSLFVVPNHLTEQWAAEYLQLYPAANILVATKKDFETKNRKKFCGRIATGDYDAVIIGHSQFEKIPMSITRQRAILQQQIDELTEGIIELKRNRGEKFTIKQLEKSKKSISQKLEKLNDQSRKDDVVTFEELGVDRVFIDESHFYKNLFLYTKMRNVGGIAQTEAQKSSDLFMKCRYLDEITGGRGTVFATGTPISNSMVELYTIQRYLQYGTLVKNNLQHFDAWASTFGETVTAVELTPEGTGYRAKTRFAKFYNLPELMAMFKEVADIKTADMLNLPVPEAKFHNVAVKPSEMQKEMVESLAERAEAVRSGGVDSSVDNMLKITNDGRKLALDQRMLNEMLPDFADSKVNACVDNIHRIWSETMEKKSAQLVFCDLSTPKNDGRFSVYNDIRKKLIERGIPENEVRFIHEADTDMKKKELFQKTRKGDVRVLLGSTQKMGAGTNVQDKLVALHDVDCPWRPSDLEQRSGRIIRQGNENPEVNIYRYVTEQTFDAYLYQLVEGKQKFASQIMTSKSPVRSAEDIDETALSYAEIKMLATGNPYIKEKMDLDIQVQKLKLLKSNFLSEKYRLEDKIIKYYPQRITFLETRIAALTKDVATAKANPKPLDDRFIGMKVSDIFYAEKAEAGKAIIEACKTMTSPDPIVLGAYRGFQTELLFNTVERSYEVKLKGETSRNVSLGEDPLGNIIRLDNGIEKFAEGLSSSEYELENTKKQYETAKQEAEKPFVHEEELKGKLARLDELNILLNMDKKENEIVGGEPDEGEREPTKKEKSNERDSR
ncbi:DEAD/DEAH box helicase family protein [Enterococcus avium]|uniref:DEAD/DEAH box helicase family protein n=1 Tax=Enterococcus avium TaxID=33945 RepID=UPI0028906DD0|nr:DEAD/DEAH box helicase family protein [Enterococcus avium]MDT2465366.1 DEAD/DEAH box helicase family protein [Enterococcus avium]MDT2504793.1 DEAD/DEAH box helicase family protein [Enterococcus avium]